MPLEDRTEQATPQHRQDARKKGQVAKSSEIVSTFVLLSGLLVLKACTPSIMGQLATFMAQSLGNLSSFHGTEEGAQELFRNSTLIFFKAMAPILGAVFVGALVANVAQVGFFFSTESLAPDMNRFDPIKGIARLFSMRALVELLKSLLKVAIIGYVAHSFLKDQQSSVVSLGMLDKADAGRYVGDVIWKLCIRTTSVLLIISVLDYIYQRFQFEKSIRMTKQEVKEEYKRTEGDPIIKSQFKRKHRELAMKRMMQDVPKADVIITNPTRLAIALKYDGQSMAAPIVLAKGQRLIAERIKQIARENGIPIVENKPVARALFASVEIGDPVPVELYQAVAEILAFVYKLKRGARATYAHAH